MSKSQQKIITGIYSTAPTTHLHLQGKTKKTGNQDGYSVVPIKTDWRKLQ